MLFKTVLRFKTVVKLMANLRPKVFVTRRIPRPALDLLKAKCEVLQWDNDMPVPRNELMDGIKDADGLFCLLTDKIDAEVLDKAPMLKTIGTMSVGYDHLDIPECRKRGLKLGYTPDVLTEATAELTVALLLCTARRLIEAGQEVQSGGWGTWGPMWMLGKGIKDSIVGIVGLGRIGLSVGEKLIPFHPKEILYHNATSRPHAAEKLSLKSVSFDDLLSRSDFVIISCQLNDKTKHLFNSDAFGKMKNDAILINTSRGPVVEQEALYDALSSGQIRAAGIDVTYPEPLPTNHKLLSLKNCVVLPHIGSATEETRTRMATLAAENILAALSGEEMPTPIP